MIEKKQSKLKAFVVLILLLLFTLTILLTFTTSSAFSLPFIGERQIIQTVGVLANNEILLYYINLRDIAWQQGKLTSQKKYFSVLFWCTAPFWLKKDLVAPQITILCVSD